MEYLPISWNNRQVSLEDEEPLHAFHSNALQKALRHNLGILKQIKDWLANPPEVPVK